MAINALLDRVRGRIAHDLKTAMKARQQMNVLALRRALNVLDNATAARGEPSGRPARAATTEAARRVVGHAEIEALLLAEAQECAAAAVSYRRLGQMDRAAGLTAEARVIRGCLKHLQVVGG